MKVTEELYHYAIVLPKSWKPKELVCITHPEISLKQGYHQCHFLINRKVCCWDMHGILSSWLLPRHSQPLCYAVISYLACASPNITGEKNYLSKTIAHTNLVKYRMDYYASTEFIPVTISRMSVEFHCFWMWLCELFSWCCAALWVPCSIDSLLNVFMVSYTQPAFNVELTLASFLTLQQSNPFATPTDSNTQNVVMFF